MDIQKGVVVVDRGAACYQRYLNGDNSGLEELVEMFNDSIARVAERASPFTQISGARPLFSGIWPSEWSIIPCPKANGIRE